MLGGRCAAPSPRPEGGVFTVAGARAVFSSREPAAFGAGVRAATGGRGVDAVLNSLAGEEAVQTSLGLLRPFGQFCELGKRDAYADAPLRQRAFLNGVSRHASRPDASRKFRGAFDGPFLW